MRAYRIGRAAAEGEHSRWAPDATFFDGPSLCDQQAAFAWGHVDDIADGIVGQVNTVHNRGELSRETHLHTESQSNGDAGWMRSARLFGKRIALTHPGCCRWLLPPTTRCPECQSSRVKVALNAPDAVYLFGVPSRMAHAQNRDQRFSTKQKTIRRR